MRKPMVKMLSYEEEKKLTREELIKYYDDLRKQFIEVNKRLHFKSFRENIHSILLRAMKAKIKGNVVFVEDEEFVLDPKITEVFINGERQFFNSIKVKYDRDTCKIYEIIINDEIVDINDSEIIIMQNGKQLEIDGIKVSVETDDRILNYDGPVIFSINHTNSQDVPVASLGAKDHYYVIAGDEVRYDINGLFFNLNGVYWVDRGDKKSQALAQEDAVSASLKYHINNLRFFESTWNRTENSMMLPLYWGGITESKITTAPILPIVIDYHTYDNEDGNIYVRVGKPIFISIFDDRKDKCDYLTEVMSTMRWNLWDRYSHDIRDNVSRRRFREEVIEKDLNDYPKLDPVQEEEYILRRYKTPEEVFSYINVNEINESYIPFDEVAEKDQNRYNNYKHR